MTSLQDQLLKAGMVDAKKAKKVEKEKRKQAKQVRRGDAQPDNSAKIAVQQAKQEKANKDREVNQNNKLLAEKKAITAQIKQLIQTNKIIRQNNDIGYQFVDGKKIKKLYVDAIQQKQLEKGQIAIVYLNGNYELVATAVAEKIKQRDEKTVILLNDRAENSSSEVDEDDPYADFKVPDDLMW